MEALQDKETQLQPGLKGLCKRQLWSYVCTVYIILYSIYVIQLYT